MTEEMLEIVDENDNVIGTASRKEIHAKGLRHREIHVLFVTPSGDILFQRRSLSKDVNPGLLAATVGGHVDIGTSYETTVIKETKEETGLEINMEDLILLNKISLEEIDLVTKTNNSSLRMIYGYIFQGSIEDLTIEKGDGDGFVRYPLKDMQRLSEKDKKEFTPILVDPHTYGPLYERLLALVTK